MSHPEMFLPGSIFGDICDAVRAFLELAVAYLTDEVTSEAVLR